MQSFFTFLLLLASIQAVWCFPSKVKNANDSLPRKKITFVHSFELGTLIKLGDTNAYINDHQGYKSTLGWYNLTPAHSELLSIRSFHGIVLKHHLEAGITVGADLYIQPDDFSAHVPILFQLGYTTVIKGRVGLVVAERIGYAFYLRKHDADPIITFKGVEGGAASETVIGITIKGRKKVTPQLLLGYRFQHINIRTVFHASNSLVSQLGYNTGLPSDMNITINTLEHFLYLSLGLRF